MNFFHSQFNSSNNLAQNMVFPENHALSYFYAPYYCLYPYQSLNQYQIIPASMLVSQQCEINEAVVKPFNLFPTYQTKKQEIIPKSAPEIKEYAQKLKFKNHQKKNTIPIAFQNQLASDEEWCEQESKVSSKPYSNHVYGSNKKSIYKQNPSRNSITNIGNQIITYICTQKKSKTQLDNFLRSDDQEGVRQFYAYARKLKNSTDYYLNRHKIKAFWFQEKSQQDKKFKKVIRGLSRYFLREIIMLSIITSKKMSSESKIYHLKCRKDLLKILKGQML